MNRGNQSALPGRSSISRESNNPDATQLAFNWAMSVCNEALASPKSIRVLSL